MTRRPSWTRLAAVALAAVALVAVVALAMRRDDEAAAAVLETPAVTITHCDAPNPTVMGQRCGWYRAWEGTPKLWRLHWGELDRLPPQAQPSDGPYQIPDPPNESTPTSVPWWVTYWWLALIGIVVFVWGIRVLLPRRSRAAT